MGVIGIILTDIDSMRIELVRDLDIEPNEYEKTYIAFVEQNSSILENILFKYFKLS